MDQEDDHDDLVVEFMQLTACSSLADAAQHLASCGWRLAEAVNLYFAAVAGSSSSAEQKPLRDPIPARSDTLYGATSSSASSRQPPAARPTGWESDSEHGNLVAAPADRRRRRRRRRRHDERASADNNTDDAVEPAAKKKKSLAELFSPPLDLAYKGGFHDAKSHAAETSRWLLVNVQATAEFASHQQNRDVWANDLVAQAVRDHFVLWQVDVHDRRGGNENEGGKVSCYYKLAQDKMPVVLVVDPVTGQMMRKLRAATDPNDILVMAESFADRKPIMPRRSANNNLLAVSSAAPSSSPPGSSSGEKKEPAITARKQGEAVAAAVAAPIGEGRAPGAEKACKLRVRFPDGQVVTKEFGPKCSVAALFAFCRSSVANNGEEQPFRLMRFAGGSMQEISHDNVSFEDLGLHMSTVSMALC
ncbi:hypothetical protein ACQ4PT_024358 [Festuca glaucescens]